jgi:hypothetical protein
MIGTSAIIALMGALLVFAPHIAFRRSGIVPETSVAALRTYRIGGLVLIALALILLSLLLSE